jgi:FAD/FMN-containing dehydrogenase
MWRFMRPFMNDLGARWVNAAKYLASRRGHGARYRQTHVAFHFLLDYVPHWKSAYGRGGLIQYQSFISAPLARDAFGEMLRLCQRRGLPSYLAVLKRHRPDGFLISHGVDGYSLALDFRVTPRRRPEIICLAQELDHIVLEAGGRFYPAKDSTLRASAVSAYLGESVVDQFRALKREVDPHTVFQTNLWRRLFAEPA